MKKTNSARLCEALQRGPTVAELVDCARMYDRDHLTIAQAAERSGMRRRDAVDAIALYSVRAYRRRYRNRSVAGTAIRRYA